VVSPLLPKISSSRQASGQLGWQRHERRQEKDPPFGSYDRPEGVGYLAIGVAVVVGWLSRATRSLFRGDPDTLPDDGAATGCGGCTCRSAARESCRNTRFKSTTTVGVRAASRVGTMSEPRPTARREWLLTVEDRWFPRALRIRPDLRNEEPTPTDVPERDQEGGRE